MIQDIKKYNVWLVYVCMWVFSFFTVWYTAIVMYYTLVHVTKSGYASDFIKIYLRFPMFQCVLFISLYLCLLRYFVLCPFVQNSNFFIITNDSYLY